MTLSWEALDSRARGLATRLLGRRRIEDLAAAADLAAVVDGLIASRLVAAGTTESAAALERAVEGAAAGGIRCLERWAGDNEALAIVFEHEDRRCVRRLFRGAAQAASPAARLAGLLPTPRLPLAVIRDLAAQPSPAAVVSRLARYKHPLAPQLAAAVARGETDLFHLELALNRAFADRARRCARWAPRQLRKHIGLTIDVENVWSALFTDSRATDSAALFLDGGERMRRETFLTTIRANDLRQRRRILAAPFADTPLATQLLDDNVTLSQLERGLLSAQIAEQIRAARFDPLGPAPVLAYVLRLRGETHDLLRVIWGKMSGMPPALILEELVTP